MKWEDHFNELIDAGWKVVSTDYDETAFQVWRDKALEFAVQFAGPEDAFTRLVKCRGCRETSQCEWVIFEAPGSGCECGTGRSISNRPWRPCREDRTR